MFVINTDEEYYFARKSFTFSKGTISSRKVKAPDLSDFTALITFA